jgi:hypothetical protein
MMKVKVRKYKPFTQCDRPFSCEQDIYIRKDQRWRCGGSGRCEFLTYDY